MKIALINPFITSRERYGNDIGDIGGHHAPLGLLCLAAFLEKHGFEVSLIDAEAERIDHAEILERIKKSGVEVIGITSTTVAFHRAVSLAKDIKSYNPRMPVIIGGSHVSANAQETLSCEYFDFGVVHEGEITTLNLLRSIEKNTSAENIQGVVYRKNGHVTCNEPRPYIKDLDSLPLPARHLLPDINIYCPPLGCYLNTPAVSILTSRGCPYECIFCDNNVFGRNIRYNSPNYVVSEIEDVIGRYGAKEIAFADDTFTTDKDRVMRILRLIRERDIRIKWSCTTRVDTITKELLKDMKKSGCWQVSIGVESGNQAVLDFIKKKISLEQVRNTVKWCRQEGIYVKGFFMLGHPIDTIETIDETIRFAKTSAFDDIIVSLATPIKGTRLYSIAADYGTISSCDWSDFSYWKPVFVPRGLSKSILYRKQAQFYAGFYLRPKTMMRQFCKIRSFSQLLKYALNIPKAAVSLLSKSVIHAAD